MSTMTEYNQAAASVPDEALLGSLVWYTISDVDINYEKAKRELEDRGLNAAALKPIRSVDAYRLATKELKRSFPMADHLKLNILVRNVGQDADAVYRQIVCERVNTKPGQKRRLIYDPSADVIFHRNTKTDDEATGSIEVRRRTPAELERDMTPDQKEWLDARLDELHGRFHHLRTHLGNHKVRNFVREYLHSLGAVAVRESGGVYFVRQSRKDELENLGGWIQDIGSAFHSTPLLDLMNQREMLARSFEEEAIKEVERLSGEIDNILQDSNRKVREKTFDDYALRAAELTSKAKEYADMLDIRSEIAHKRIDHFKKKTMELVDRISYDDNKA